MFIRTLPLPFRPSALIALLGVRLHLDGAVVRAARLRRLALVAAEEDVALVVAHRAGARWEAGFSAIPRGHRRSASAGTPAGRPASANSQAAAAIGHASRMRARQAVEVEQVAVAPVEQRQRRARRTEVGHEQRRPASDDSSATGHARPAPGAAARSPPAAAARPRGDSRASTPGVSQPSQAAGFSSASARRPCTSSAAPIDDQHRAAHVAAARARSSADEQADAEQLQRAFGRLDQQGGDVGCAVTARQTPSGGAPSYVIANRRDRRGSSARPANARAARARRRRARRGSEDALRHVATVPRPTSHRRQRARRRRPLRRRRRWRRGRSGSRRAAGSEPSAASPGRTTARVRGDRGRQSRAARAQPARHQRDEEPEAERRRGRWRRRRSGPSRTASGANRPERRAGDGRDPRRRTAAGSRRRCASAQIAASAAGRVDAGAALRTGASFRCAGGRGGRGPRSCPR